MAGFTACDLVQFIYNYYPSLLCTIQRIFKNFVLIYQLLSFFLLENFPRLTYWSFLYLCPWRSHLLDYILKIHANIFYSGNNALHNDRFLLGFYFHHSVFKFTLSQLVSEFLASCFFFLIGRIIIRPYILCILCIFLLFRQRQE